MKENILEVKDLNVYYTNKGGFLKHKNTKQHVLKNVSFTMRKGEVLGLVGESGCGKTSLAKAILGMQKQFDGEIQLDCPNPQMVFQDPYAALNPAKKIAWILEEPLRRRKQGDGGASQEKARDWRRNQVDEMLERVLHT